MNHFRALTVFVAGFAVACSSSPPDTSDASTDSSVNDSSNNEASIDAGIDGPTPTTTIAAARQTFLDAGSVAPITVNAIVTAVQGPANDQVIWYVEDPTGGPYSGISVFCDPSQPRPVPAKRAALPTSPLHHSTHS